MPLLRFGGYGRPVMIACLGTANYYTTVPFTMLLVLLGVVMIGWPRWVIRHTPKNGDVSLGGPTALIATEREIHPRRGDRRILRKASSGSPSILTRSSIPSGSSS